MQEISERPPVTGARWSGFGCAGVGCLSYGLFGIIQFIVITIVLFHAHPDWLQVYQKLPPGQAQQAAARWVIEISTAPTLFLLALAGDGVMLLVAIALARGMLGARPAQIGIGRSATGGQLLFGLLAGAGLVVVAQLV